MARRTIICEVCGIEKSVPASETRRRFCSVKCRADGLSLSLEEKFVRHIGETTPQGCILWAGPRNGKDKYGFMRRRKGHPKILAHRYAFVRAGGVLKDGEDVLHSCDNPPCINPEHLRAGTAKENSQDSVSKLRHVWGERNGNTKLKNADIPQIRQLIADGVPYAKIQEMYPISAPTISGIKHGTRWRLVQ